MLSICPFAIYLPGNSKKLCGVRLHWVHNTASNYAVRNSEFTVKLGNWQANIEGRRALLRGCVVSKSRTFAQTYVHLCFLIMFNGSYHSVFHPALYSYLIDPLLLGYRSPIAWRIRMVDTYSPQGFLIYAATTRGHVSPQRRIWAVGEDVKGSVIKRYRIHASYTRP